MFHLEKPQKKHWALLLFGLLPGSATETPNDPAQMLFQRPGDQWPLASLRAKPADAEQARDAWLPYITVEDCADTTRRAEELGGTIEVRDLEIGDMATMSVVIDPAGGRVALWQMRAMMG